jgi:hypothetical protein
MKREALDISPTAYGVSHLFYIFHLAHDYYAVTLLEEVI